MPRCLAAWILTSFLVSSGALAGAENDSLSADEFTLRAAHIGSDGPSLVRYLRQRIPKEVNFDRIEALIRQLGHESFAVREDATRQLLMIGPAAAPKLRQAASNPDPEVRRRAQGCLQQIARTPDGSLAGALTTALTMFRPQPGGLETLVAYLSAWDSMERSGSPAVILAGVRLLSARHPTGAAQVLLDYLPYVVDESVSEEIDSALGAVALRNGAPDPDLLSALQDKLNLRRGAAAVALCRAGGLPMAALVRPLLNDPDPVVRQRIATVLADFRDPEAMPVLIALLDQLAPAEAQQVDEVLRHVAGELATSVSPGGQTADSWRKCRESWEAWWRSLDGRNLLQQFQRRTPLDADHERMLALILKLGDDEFEMRQQASAQLQAMGPLALPVLRQGLKSLDPEVVQRAQVCKEQIEKSWQPQVGAGAAEAIGLGPGILVLLPGFLQKVRQIEKDPATPIPSAAARLVAMRRPPGAAEVLLAYLPFAEDEMEVEEIQGALTTLAFLDGPANAALIRGLDDKISVRRATAAVALCRARGINDGEPGGVTARRLLRDRDPLVRLRVALALTDLKDRNVIPELIDLLAELPEEQAWPAEDLLRRLAGDHGPADAAGPDSNSRRKWRDAWAAWWRDHGLTVDMTILDRHPRLLGYTVVAEYTDGRNGRVLEYGADGRVRWKVENIPWPLDVEVLPGQRLLLTEFYDQRVAERNFRGELLWHKQLTQNPLSARRLPNGNTLIVTQNQILEVDRAGREVSNISRPGIVAAEKLRSGRVASIDSAGGLTIFDAAGRPAKSFSVGAFQNYSSFQVLPNGGVVVPLTGQNQIAEFNAQGKRVWEASAIRPTSAVRLSNGHTLVACRDSQIVVELDRSGKQVWQQKSTGYPWRAYRR
jgi:HEAT repeat protein